MRCETQLPDCPICASIRGMNMHRNPANTDHRARIRLFVEYDLEHHHAVPATPNQHSYLRKVMRRKDGDMVALFNGRHGEWLARIAYEGKSRCMMIVEQHLPAAACAARCLAAVCR